MGTSEKKLSEVLHHKECKDGKKDTIVIKDGCFLDVTHFNSSEDKYKFNLKKNQEIIRFKHLGSLYVGIKNGVIGDPILDNRITSLVIIKDYAKDIPDTEQTLHNNIDKAKEVHYFIEAIENIKKETDEMNIKLIKLKKEKHEVMVNSAINKIDKGNAISI